MLALLSNAFNDPSNPWYYVIGVLFLLLIFGALAVYVIWSGKKKKENENEQEKTSETTDPDEVAAESNVDSVTEAPDTQEQKEEE